MTFFNHVQVEGSLVTQRCNPRVSNVAGLPANALEAVHCSTTTKWDNIMLDQIHGSKRSWLVLKFIHISIVQLISTTSDFVFRSGVHASILEIGWNWGENDWDCSWNIVHKSNRHCGSTHIDFDDLSFASLTASHLQFPRLPKSGDSASNTAMSVWAGCHTTAIVLVEY
jgi:hypothetical protein